jgi:hypothetical protein
MEPKIRGVSPDAPIVTNEKGGKQSDTPYGFNLFAPRAMFRLAEVMRYGEKRYGRDNWRKISADDHVNHLLQHIFAWMAGDRSDDHVGHAFARAMMFAEMAMEEEQAAEQWPPIVAVDFDGCLCINEWPKIGAPNLPLIQKCIDHRKNGGKVILWTCRERNALADAVEWCESFGLEFDAVNENLPEMNALYGNDSRKIGADLYIDDKALKVLADG